MNSATRTTVVSQFSCLQEGVWARGQQVDRVETGVADGSEGLVVDVIQLRQLYRRTGTPEGT